MSQEDYVVDNASGASVRADINAQLGAVATNNSGATAPNPTFANMWWFDTSTNLLKQRNNANTAWITVAAKDGSGWRSYFNGTETGGWSKRDATFTSVAGNHTVVAADNGRWLEIDSTAANRTVDLLAVATAGVGFFLAVKSIGTGGNDVILDGNGAETVNGAATVTLADGQTALLVVNATENRAIVIDAAYASSGTGMLFAQASAPAGWTQDTDISNESVPIITTGSGGGTGGSWTISGLSVLGHATTLAETANHGHLWGDSGLTAASGSGVTRVAGGNSGHSTSADGGGATHVHGMSADGAWRPLYYHVIRATKD